jgi:hypothetical protein
MGFPLRLTPRSLPHTYPLPGCEHAFCGECLSMFCRSQLRDRRYPLSCPYPRCTAAIDGALVRGLLGSADEQVLGLLEKVGPSLQHARPAALLQMLQPRMRAPARHGHTPSGAGVQALAVLHRPPRLTCLAARAPAAGAGVGNPRGAALLLPRRRLQHADAAGGQAAAGPAAGLPRLRQALLPQMQGGLAPQMGEG